ncbi:MAG: methyltransferase domain-containing protein [Acidobacteria bacterium]|nr:methyltransferase domain-containing protein [Acidobacteriota bacterium]MYG75052.1 methyltransferase domain-containing protein [Acidobacteriota bacterium]
MPGAGPPQAAGGDWDPAQYDRFRDFRLRPALELLDRVCITRASLVYDLGCGAGTITRIVADRFPGARVVGLDRSPRMLAKARAEPSRVEWVHGNIADWEPEQAPDLIFSNAALHWLEDHQALLPRLLDYLAPGGCLAVQMPLSHAQPSHVLMCETLANGGVGGAPLGDETVAAAAGRDWVLDSDTYYDLLAPGASEVDIWETEYLHRLEGEDAVLEWVRATGLRPVLNGLAGADLERFLEVYRERLRDAYPRRADGSTVYRFPRLFLVATRRDP